MTRKWALNYILSSKAIETTVGGNPDISLRVLKRTSYEVASQTFFVIKFLDKAAGRIDKCVW